jgi:hypothetical protein
MAVKQLNDTTIKTGLVRISYAHIIDPVPIKDDDGGTVVDASGQPKTHWTCAFIVPKSDTETVEALRTIQRNAAKLKFADKVPSKWAAGLRDGDTDPAALVDALDPSKGIKSELKGCYWFNATAKLKPRVIGPKKDEFTGQFPVLQRGEIKSGDYVHAQINAYGFDNPKNKGVGFGFAIIQLKKEGESLGGVIYHEDAFEEDEELADSFE